MKVRVMIVLCYVPGGYVPVELEAKLSQLLEFSSSQFGNSNLKINKIEDKSLSFTK